MQGLRYRAATAAAEECKNRRAGVGLRNPGAESGMEAVQRLASENAVLIFSVSSCCMCHVVKRLFCSLGVNPVVCELDEEEDALGGDIEKALIRLVGGDKAAPPVPAVFVGGKLLGGLDRVMAAHISGDLVPRLKEAGALWL